MKVPQIDLVRQYNEIKPEIDGAVADVLASGSYILGPWVKEIERVVAGLAGAGHAIGCASGTDALELALVASGVGPGDEVITSPFSFVSVAEVAARLGARVVFVDIDQRTFNLDAQAVRRGMTPKTKAVVPVHLYGQSADMDPMMAAAAELSVPVIEDACQAIGARYKDRPVGSIGTMACLSFYPTKNLGCYGDGGMVLTNDADTARRLTALARHGQTGKYSYELVGFNSRLDSVQAAILLVKAKRLGQWNEARRRAATLYDEALAGLPVETPYVADYAYHVYHQYTVKADRRDDLRVFLTGKGISTAVHYPLGLHLQEAYRYLGYTSGDLPNCDEAAGLVISLPMFPGIEDTEIEFVAGAIREFYGSV